MTNVTVQLDSDEAVVLFEALSRWSNDEGPLISDMSEEYALDKLLAVLEKTLIEPFRPDFRTLVEEARSRLRRRAGQRE